MAYVQQTPVSRMVAFSFVVLFHIFLIWALKSGLARSVVDMLKGPLNVNIIEELLEEEAKPPPPPPPKLQDIPPAYVPPPEFNVEAVTETTETAITNVQSTQRAPPPPPPPKKVAAAPVNPKSIKITQATYPPTSRRLGEEGSVMLAVYITAEGAVQDAKVARSSGFPRLDESALREAMKKRWKFKPGTVDGAPAAMWYEFLMTFKLTD